MGSHDQPQVRGGGWNADDLFFATSRVTEPYCCGIETWRQACVTAPRPLLGCPGQAHLCTNIASQASHAQPYDCAVFGKLFPSSFISFT